MRRRCRSAGCFRASGTIQRSLNCANNAWQVGEHLVSRKPQHSPPETRELCVARFISARALHVITAIDLNDELPGGSGEVSDEVTHHELPPKPNAELATRERGPEGLLRRRRRLTLTASVASNGCGVAWIEWLIATRHE